MSITNTKGAMTVSDTQDGEDLGKSNKVVMPQQKKGKKTLELGSRRVGKSMLGRGNVI